MPTKRREPNAPAKGQAKEKRMARKSHHALSPAEEPLSGLSPNQLTKQEFGRRLATMIADHHWSQSDFVREVELQTGEKLGRDSISTYIRGMTFPTPKSLKLMCETLGVSRDELLPNATIQAINDEHPALELRAAAGHPGKAWVRVNRMMTFETATEIVKLINEEDRTDFERR